MSIRCGIALAHFTRPQAPTSAHKCRWRPQKPGRTVGREDFKSPASADSATRPKPYTCPSPIIRLPYSTSTYVSCLPRSARIGQERDKGQASTLSSPRCDWSSLPNPSAGYRKSWSPTPVARPADPGRSFRDAQDRRMLISPPLVHVSGTCCPSLPPGRCAGGAVWICRKPLMVNALLEN